MRCPGCRESRGDVIDSREIGNSIRRRRSCQCGHRFTTYEQIEESPKFGRAIGKRSRIETEMDAIADIVEKSNSFTTGQKAFLIHLIRGFKFAEWGLSEEA